MRFVSSDLPGAGHSAWLELPANRWRSGFRDRRPSHRCAPCPTPRPATECHPAAPGSCRRDRDRRQPGPASAAHLRPVAPDSHCTSRRRAVHRRPWSSARGRQPVRDRRSTCRTPRVRSQIQPRRRHDRRFRLARLQRLGHELSLSRRTGPRNNSESVAPRRRRLRRCWPYRVTIKPTLESQWELG
jgi:hypothetical protein